MKAILINSIDRTVSEVTLKGDSLTALQTAVGGYITVGLDLPNGDTLYVDDEGLLKGNVTFFEVKNAHQPFAGNGVIVNTTKEGESAPVKSSLEDIKARISFTDIYELRKKYA